MERRSRYLLYAIGDLIRCGILYIQYLDEEGDVLASKRVVTIEGDRAIVHMGNHHLQGSTHQTLQAGTTAPRSRRIPSFLQRLFHLSYQSTVAAMNIVHR